MAAKSIGVWTFDLFHGDVQSRRTATDVTRRLGRDGFRAFDVGRRARESVIRTTEFVADQATSDVHELIYYGYVGEVETITDDLGREYEDCLIRDVRVRVRQAYQGGTLKWRLDATWTVLCGER